MDSDSPQAETDEDLRRLVSALESLVDGELAVTQLIACGPKAIQPLREFLLHGRRRSVFQPRMRAVEALAGLGAKSVLIEYLLATKSVADPQVRAAEESVENTTARRLSAWRDQEAFQVLLAVCRRRLLPGAVETLAEHERAEAIPCFDRALENDFCRQAAEEGFRRLGIRARRALVLSATTPLPYPEEERPSSIRRRRSALALLTEMGIESEDWPELRCLLLGSDAEMRARLAQLAAVTANSDDRSTAATNLVASFPELPWYAREGAENALVALAPESMAAVQDEITRRSSLPTLVRAADEVLRTLVRINTKFGSHLLHLPRGDDISRSRQTG